MFKNIIFQVFIPPVKTCEKLNKLLIKEVINKHKFVIDNLLV